jgi:hypothetical protein
MSAGFPRLQDHSAAELLREVVGVDHAGETPAHILLLIAPLPATVAALDAAHAMKRSKLV